MVVLIVSANERFSVFCNLIKSKTLKDFCSQSSFPFIQPLPNHPPGTKLIHFPSVTKTENTPEVVKPEAESKPKGKAGYLHLLYGSLSCELFDDQLLLVLKSKTSACTGVVCHVLYL